MNEEEDLYIERERSRREEEYNEQQAEDVRQQQEEQQHQAHLEEEQQAADYQNHIMQQVMAEEPVPVDPDPLPVDPEPNGDGEIEVVLSEPYFSNSMTASQVLQNHALSGNLYLDGDDGATVVADIEVGGINEAVQEYVNEAAFTFDLDDANDVSDLDAVQTIGAEEHAFVNQRDTPGAYAPPRHHARFGGSAARRRGRSYVDPFIRAIREDADRRRHIIEEEIAGIRARARSPYITNTAGSGLTISTGTDSGDWSAGNLSGSHWTDWGAPDRPKRVGLSAYITKQNNESKSN
jgi:hypothetical protein